MSKDISAPRPGLLRALGPLMGTAVVVGTVIGSGVFKKPQVVADNVPYFGVAALVWIGIGLLALLGALSLAEVAVLFPRAGGNYVFLREGYGRLAGFLWGWVEFWIIRSASIAALAAIFAESLVDMLRNPAFQETLHLNLGSQPLSFWGQCWLTVAVILGLAIVNVLGVRWGGLLQLFITIIKVASLLAIAALPFVVAAFAPSGSNAPAPRIDNLSPWWPSWNEIAPIKIGAALVAVLWAYHGWMNFAPVAEEIRNPNRNIPTSVIAGVMIVITVYLGANLGYYLIIPQPEMAQIKTTTVATEFCMRLLGPIGAAAGSAAVMCSVFGALNGNLLVGPRLLYAMGEDGLAPRALAEVHPRFRTPALAILALALWSVLLVVAGALLIRYRLPKILSLDINLPKDETLFDVMTNFAMFGAVIFETLAVTTIFVFRRRMPAAPRPYRCPGYPVVPFLYLFLPAFMLTSMFVNQAVLSLAGLGFITLGALVYFSLLRKQPAP
ncbi:MAG TPA: amino acid permease [Gemmataceae bacterium]|nr:amino acid permease [Gemmataceae bacterium]